MQIRPSESQIAVEPTEKEKKLGVFGRVRDVVRDVAGAVQEAIAPEEWKHLFNGEPPELMRRVELFDSANPPQAPETPLKSTISVLGIRGVPTGIPIDPLRQDGKAYFNPYDIANLIHNIMEGKYGNEAKTIFEHSSWTKDAGHPWKWLGEEAYESPIALVAYHVAYRRDEEYRKEVISATVARIEEHLKHSQVLVICAHSYGTIVAMDAINELINKEKYEEASRIIVIGLGPSYRPILHKASPIGPHIENHKIQRMLDGTKGCFFARVGHDSLSAPFPPEKDVRRDPKRFSYKRYPPSLIKRWELGPSSHTTITCRPDVLEDIKKFIERMLAT